MTKLLRRIAQLEAQLADRSGLIPGTEAWVHYWCERINRMLEHGEPCGVTLDIVDQLRSYSREQPEVAESAIHLESGAPATAR